MDLNDIQKILIERDDALSLRVLGFLKDNPLGLTRARLAALVYPAAVTVSAGMDRNVRRAIKRLRDLGLVIISSTDKAGYRLATDDDTLIVRRYALQQYKAARSRIATASKVLKAYGLKDNLRLSGV